MKEIFKRVQSGFMGLEGLLNGVDLKKELSTLGVFEKINDALIEIYVLLNEGFCENVKLCEQCNDNRDQLRTLIELMDKHEENTAINKEIPLYLENFKQNIPNILRKMQSIDPENLDNTQA